MVAQRGSMAQAAAHLGVSQPAVSEAIADLESTLGVPLFERSTRGVKPTMYARAMMDHSVAAFDELKQGIRTLESLADPAAGELWIGCIESVATLILPPILKQFMRRFPRVMVRVMRLSSPIPAMRDLCERNLDVVLGRMVNEPAADADLTFEPLFDDPPVVAAGANGRWARQRSVDLADLVDEPWILTPPDCWIHTAVKEAFRQRGLKSPHVALTSYSMPLRMSLAASGPYITVFPDYIRQLNGHQRAIRILPIALPALAAPFAIITLKNRKLNPVAERFIEHLRDHLAGRRGDAALPETRTAVHST